MTETSRPAHLSKPTCEGVEERTFLSEYDQTPQTYLIKDFRSATQNRVSLIVIYLHGSGSHQEQGLTAGTYGGAFEQWAAALSLRSAIYICPEYRGNSWMGPAAECDLQQIIAHVRHTFTPARIILTGGSMGGTSALIFATRNPDMVDGVIALCPATDVAEMYPRFPEEISHSYGGSPDTVPVEFAGRKARDFASSLTGKRMAIVHGEADDIIPISHSRDLVQRLPSEDLQYVEIPAGDHDSPLSYSFIELLKFVLPDGR